MQRRNKSRKMVAQDVDYAKLRNSVKIIVQGYQ
jgi:hypothetical protein